MSKQEQIVIGELVRSAAGHDKGGLYVIVGIEQGFAVICNGRDRKVQKPKRKKIKHIKRTGIVFDWILKSPELVNNSSVRRAISEAKND